MLRLLTYTMMFLAMVTGLKAMDFGLRFQSHSSPTESRTTFFVGDTRFKFDRDFKLGFDFNFYSGTTFGLIATVDIDNGNSICIVNSYMPDGSNKLGLVVNDELKHLDSPHALESEREYHVDLTLDKSSGMAVLSLGGDSLCVAVDMSAVNSATFQFGKDQVKKRSDVAPMELSSIRVSADGNDLAYWNLTRCSSPNKAVDSIGGVEAVVLNPHWLIDDHTQWRKIYSGEFKDKVQTAFDPKSETFYIVSNNKLLTYSPRTGDKDETDIKSGRRPMVYSNHLMFDTISRQLINYNLTRRETARLDLHSAVWDYVGEGPDAEANYSNHAFAVDGRYMYVFGGYGFYKFHNDFFKIDLSDGTFEECALSPEIMPMASSSMAVTDGKIYIFGGRGNASGRQEMPTSYQYALYAYDIATMKGGKVWELDSVTNDFLPSQTMYYDKEGDCFYMATTFRGGTLMRISRSAPECEVMSADIHSNMDAFDYVFDLFRSDDEKRYYLLIDRRMDPVAHDYAIYTISAPFIPGFSVDEAVPDSQTEASDGSRWLWPVIIFVVAVLIAAVILAVRCRRRRPAEDEQVDDSGSGTPLRLDSPGTSIDASDDEENAVSSEADDLSDPDAADEFDYNFIVSDKPKQSVIYFDRSRSSISMLGGFCVRDKLGLDITSKFTSRLKNLLIMLLISCEDNSAGIRYQIIDEEIWYDKDEKSAQNNRNVSMRKLRLLLEEVGDISITYDKGFFKIDTRDVFFDYHEIMKRISAINHTDNVSPELVDEILELLLMGPLLPNTHYDWLDRYKGHYSDEALKLLNKLLKYEFGRDDDMAYKIAETISLHELLSEEAMIAKCRILSKRKMIRMAQNVHQKFCKEYFRSLGEEYPHSFVSVCRKDF